METQEHRRFAEFCDACKRYRYIGLCYGSPGVGKTLSARHYANWERVQACWNLECQPKPLLKEISKGTVAFYTSPVVASPGHLDRDIGKSRSLLYDATIERARRYEYARMIRLLNRAEKLRDPKRNPNGYQSAEAVSAENAFHKQRDRSMRVPSSVSDPTALLVIDEADRLKVGA
ncbi:MAG TPA: AAA family ATPase [Bryobacteraceae bacterium]|nr:AAA family ATPase [Bryobacteraceae bacterium]